MTTEKVTNFILDIKTIITSVVVTVSCVVWIMSQLHNLENQITALGGEIGLQMLSYHKDLDSLDDKFSTHLQNHHKGD